jgi:NAD(P)-dependent dehydrogenase (short-subunit alcohol dehydrogenase family)
MGKVVVVTGAASGIGRSIARRLAAEGHAIAGVDIDPDGLAATIAELTEGGAAALPVAADVTPDDAFDDVIARVEAGLGPIEVLCNVAGVGVAEPLLTTSTADWDRIFALNVRAIFHSCRAVLPGMLERGGGIIVNIASVAGVVAIRDRAAYTASKFAVVGLTKSIAADYAARGIRANAICPGTVETEWIGKILANAPDPAATRAAMAARQLDGQMGTPEEVAEGVAFLVHDRGRFMNGAALVMDGGLSAV